MMVSLTFRTRVGSRIPSASTSGGTTTSLNLYIPNLVIFANIFITVLKHMKMIRSGVLLYKLQ